MIQELENKKVQVYEIDNKKYTVISKSIENTENIEKLYNVLCKFAISKLNEKANV